MTRPDGDAPAARAVVPLYAATIGDLDPQRFLGVTCLACGDQRSLSARLVQERLPATRKVRDCERLLRCTRPGCGARGRVMVDYREALHHERLPLSPALAPQPGPRRPPGGP